MSRIASIFAAHRPALIPFITGGYPSLEVTRRVVPALQNAGAAIIEIGFPFTDPIADGPVIADSMHQALLKGVTPQAIFEAVKQVRPQVSAGLMAMVSDSIVTRYGGKGDGPESFVRDAAGAGFDGLIVPDVDLDAAVPLAGLARLHGLSFTLLIAPTTVESRIERIVSLCSGFVYVLARVGITGERNELDETALRQRIDMIRRHTHLPLAVGFGISRAEQVRRVGQIADGAIVGSALVRRMAAAGEAGAVEAAAAFVKELAGGAQRP